MTIALRQRPLARVVAGIVRANDGALFDPSDLSTLYQDAAGTTPVTAVEQPVGLMLDKSRGLMLGLELVSNGDFSAGSANWSLGIASGISGSGTIAGGVATINVTSSTSNDADISYKYICNISKRVKITADVLNITGSLTAGITIRTFDGSTYVFTNYPAAISAGKLSTVTPILTAGRYIDQIWLMVTTSVIGASGSVVFDNLSVKELYGYHATQPITASRPTLSARYNLLTKTEDFSDAVWVQNSVSTTTSRYLSPIGTFTANKVTLVSGAVTTGNNGAGAFASPVITANGSAYTLSLFAKSAGSNYIRFREAINTGQRVKINLIDGSFVGEANWSPSTFTVTVTPAPNGFFLIQITRSAPTTFWFNIKGGDDVGDGVNGIYVWGIDLRLSTTPGPYQRVNTATDYDTDERYFKKYLRFDGIDDYMNLPYMGLYAAGACSIVVAMSENKVAYGTTLINETNSTLTAPMYNPTRQSDIGNNWRSLIRNDANVVTLSSTGALINADGHISVRSRIERESNTAAFENSINKESYNYARAGTLTLDKTTIGALLLGGVIGSPDNMNLYGLIITKSALTDSQRVACERFEARKSGVLM